MEPAPTEARSPRRTAVIIQPCFFPWRGQFDLISRADVVVFLDTVQYVRRSWYNRNRVMTSDGVRWLTVPVRSKGQYEAQIRDIEIDNDVAWARRSMTLLDHAYKKYPHYDEYRDDLEELLGRPWQHLAPLAAASVRWCNERLGRSQHFEFASAFDSRAESPIDRLVELCQAVGAERYLSGPAARDYIASDEPFERAGIELSWMRYDYPDYPQVRQCDTALSVLDLLFNTGADAPGYIWPGRQERLS